MLIMMLACVPVEMPAAGTIEVFAYDITDSDWRLHPADFCRLFTEDDLLTFTDAGSVLVNGNPVARWDGPWLAPEADDWAYGALLYEVDGEDWLMIPRGEPGRYQWWVKAESSEFTLYPA